MTSPCARERAVSRYRRTVDNITHTAQRVIATLRSFVAGLQPRPPHRPAGPPDPREERIRRMQLLGELRDVTCGDVGVWIGSATLGERLGWNDGTLNRLLRFHESNRQIEIEPEQFVYGRKVNMTAAGLGDVEWSIAHPTTGAEDRAPWIVRWLYVVEVLASLSVPTLARLVDVLHESARSNGSMMEGKIEEVAGPHVVATFKRLLSDPVFNGNLAAWLGVILALAALVLDCRQQGTTIDIERQVVIVQQAVDEGLRRHAEPVHDRARDSMRELGSGRESSPGPAGNETSP